LKLDDEDFQSLRDFGNLPGRRFPRTATLTHDSYLGIERNASPKNSRHNDPLSAQISLSDFSFSPTDARSAYAGREVGHCILLKRKPGTGVAYT